MTGRLDNEHILVTGGGRGIGSAIVKKCLLEGAKVSFIDLVGEEVRSLNNKLNQDNKFLFKEGNVCSVEDLKRWCDASRKVWSNYGFGEQRWQKLICRPSNNDRATVGRCLRC